ncbi:MAG: hypothetical protein AAF657_06320 [Acidobacteriota bacterium]
MRLTVVFLLVAGFLAPVAGAQQDAALMKTYSGEDLPLYNRVRAFFNTARDYRHLEIDGKPFPDFYNQMLGRMGIEPGSQEAKDFEAIINLSGEIRISEEEREALGRDLDAVDDDAARSAVWADLNGRKAAIAGDLWGKLEVLLGPDRMELVLSQVRRSGAFVWTDEPQTMWDTAGHFESARESARGVQ